MEKSAFIMYNLLTSLNTFSSSQVWRIGIMGYNSTADNVKRALAMMQEGLTVVKSDAALS